MRMQSPLTLNILLLKHVGKFLHTCSSKHNKKTRERLEWLGDAVLREIVVERALSSVTYTQQEELSEIMVLCDQCCSNATLSVVYDRATECCGFGRTSTQTNHSTKWKADIVETAIGDLSVDNTNHSRARLLDEILAIVFSVSNIPTEEGPQPAEGNNFEQLDSELDEEEDEEEDKEEDEEEDEEENEEENEGDKGEDEGEENCKQEEEEVLTLPSPARATSILGGSALHASLSLHLFLQHVSSTPKMLTRERQHSIAQKHTRWRTWEDQMTFNGSPASSSSPVRICRSKSFSGDVHEWVAEQLSKKPAVAGKTILNKIDDFCSFLARGTMTTRTCCTQSFWRHVPMLRSNRAARAALADHGLQPRDARSANKRRRSSQHETEKKMNKDNKDNKDNGRDRKKRKTETIKMPRPRGPSVTISRQDLDLLRRFEHSEVVAHVEKILHNGTSLQKGYTTIELNVPLDRRLAHAVAGLHGLESTSIDIGNSGPSSAKCIAKSEKKRRRGVRIHGDCSHESFENCSAMAELITRK